jgi:hypothetical protein
MYRVMNRAESSGSTLSSRPQVSRVRLVIRWTSRHSSSATITCSPFWTALNTAVAVAMASGSMAAW